MSDKIMNFNLNGAGVIEASAGTGKTYTITGLLCRLLLGLGTLDNEPVDFSKILVMTFTKAATNDLKRKIGERIRDLRSFMELLLKNSWGNPEEFNKALSKDRDGRLSFEAEILHALWHIDDSETDFGRFRDDEYLRKLISSIRILRNVELNMDSMCISTIHSFCRQMLAKFVVDTGLSWQFSLTNDDEDIRKRALYEALRKNMISNASGHDDEYAKVYEQFLGNSGFAKLLCLFKDYRNTREIRRFDKKSFEIAEFGILHELLKSAFAIYEDLKLKEKTLTNDDLLLKLRDALVVDEGDVESIVHRKGFLAKKIKNILPVAIIDEFQDTDPVQFEIVKSIYLSDDENDSADNKDGSAGAVSKSDFWGFYIVGDPKQSIYGFRGADLHCYNVAKRIILDRYRSEDEKAEHKIELSVNYRSDANVVKAVNCLFSGVIPREDDKDAAAPNKQGTADVRNGESASYDFYAGIDKNTSDESSAEVIERNEQRVSDGELLFTNVDNSRKQKYLYLIRNDRDKGVVREAACNFINVGLTEEMVNVGDYRHLVAEQCADKIVELLRFGRLGNDKNLTGTELNNLEQCRKLTLKDIAVLVRDKTEALEVTKSLRARKVPVVFLSDKTKIYDTDEFRFVSVLMRAVINNSQQDYLRMLLASPVFGLTGREYADAVCNRHSGSETSEVIGDGQKQDADIPVTMEFLNSVLVECNREWSETGFMSMFTGFMNRFGLMDRIRKRTDGAKIITNLLHSAELALNLSSRIKDQNELIESFENLGNETENEENGDDGKMRLTDDNDEIVRICTYHASKGLEYNIVMMPYSDTRVGKSNNFSPKITRVRGLTENENASNEDSVEASDGKMKKNENDDEASYYFVNKKDSTIWKVHQKDELLEKQRLWYVALTRACHALYLWFSDEQSEKVREKVFCLSHILFDKVFDNGEEKSLYDLYHSEYTDSPFFRFVDDYFVRNPEDNDGKKLQYQAGESGKSNDDCHPQILEADRINLKWKVFSYSSMVSGMGQVAADLLSGKENDNSDGAGSASPEEVGEYEKSEECRFTFSKGSRAGTFLHDVLEYLDFKTSYEEFIGKQGNMPLRDFLKTDDARNTELYRVLENKLRANGFSYEKRKVLELIGWFLEILSADLCVNGKDAGDSAQEYMVTSLKDLEDADCIKEMEFWLNVDDGFSIRDFNELVSQIDRHGSENSLINYQDNNGTEGDEAEIGGVTHPVLPEVTVEDINGLLTGFIDLIFKHDGRYYVADYKSNYINDHIGSYADDEIKMNMVNHHYYIQYILYTLALHRYLKCHKPDYDYDTDVGGIAYLYLRGMKSADNGNAYRGYGIYSNRITSQYIEKLDALFAGTR